MLKSPLRRPKRSSRLLRVLFCCLAGLVLQASAIALLPRMSPWQPPVANAAALNAIQLENTYPGDPTWNDFTANVDPHVLSGYGSQISVNHGQSISFYVTTTAPSLNIDIYRTGWYSGVGARHMLSMGSFTGVQQPNCPIDKTTGMVSCTNWSRTATLNVPSTWTSGVYLAKLTASNGNKSFISFVVRNDGGNEALVFQTSVTTYEAYNVYGGISLYTNTTDGSIYNAPHAMKVSFDRPFVEGNGAGQYFSYEFPFVRWAEAHGFDITYVTDVDTGTGVNPLTNHKAFISVGHDEYWSKGMRDNVQAAITAGVNVAFFSANTCYWQIRFEANSAGVANRVEVGYKDFATDTTFPGPDPMFGVNNSIVTTNWRDPVVNKPENALLGVMYENSDQNPTSTYVVQNASNWIYANTGFVDGSTVPGIVGYEYDKTWNNGFTPAGLTILSNSPVVGICDDPSECGNGGNSVSNATIYTAPSGATVFASGTIEWSWGLDNYPNRSFANAGIQQTTANILYRFTGTTPPPPPPPPPAGTYFTDGFESGNMTQWSGPFGTTQGTAETSVVNSGSYAASLIANSGQYGDLTTPLYGGAESLTYTRLYFRVASPGATTTLAQGRDVNNKIVWTVYYDAGRHGIDAYFWNGAGTQYALYSAMNIVAPDAWYGLEIEDNEQVNGHAEVWLNGASILTVSNDLSDSTPYSTLQLWDEGAGTVYYDDIKVSNAYNGPVGGSYPGPAATISPSSLTFSNQNVHTTSTPQALTLTNTGTAPLTIGSFAMAGTNASDFSQTNNCPVSVGVGNSCTINVTFSPSGSGARTAALTINDTAPGGLQSITLNGTGVFPPPPANGIYFSDGFENGLTAWSSPSGPGQATAQSTVVNTGTSALALTNTSGQYIGLTGALIGGGETLTYTRFYFRVASPANGTTTLAQGRDQNGTLMWVVVYDAGRHGIDAYFWNGANARYDLYSVTNIVAPSAWYGLEIEDNEQSTGHAEIWLNGVSIGAIDGDLSVTQGGYSQLALINEVVGTTYFDDVQISNKYNGAVGGGGYPVPGASLSPTSVSYGNQNTGSTSSAQTVTLTNTGTVPLTITTTTIGGTNASDFIKGTDTCAGATVAPEATCTIAVSFAPGASGSRSGTLTINDNAPGGGSQTVTLSGTGVTPPPPPPPANGVYVSDGFEGGNLSQWTPSGPGQASAQTTVVNTGNYAAALTNASGQYCSISSGLIGGGEALTYTSFAFRIASPTTTTAIAQGNDANGSMMWAIVYDAGRQGLDVYVWNGARARYDLYSNTNLITADTWYTLEFEMNEVTAGHAEVWLNGVSIASVDGDLSTTSAYAQLTVENGSAGTVYFDDVKVANVK